jgi:hypothetical protein
MLALLRFTMTESEGDLIDVAAPTAHPPTPESSMAAHTVVSMRHRTYWGIASASSSRT